MALFHLLFTLIKIAILASGYATLTLVAFRIIGHDKPESWFYRVSRRKWRLWFRSGFFISLGLFVFMCTHFGNHEFGDMARVPVGHWRAIHDVDGVQAYIEEEGIPTQYIDQFVVTDDYVYGLIGGDFHDNQDNNADEFFVYDLDNNTMTTFDDHKKYVNFLKAAALDPDPEYKDFDYYYWEYWGGWRSWLLP